MKCIVEKYKNIQAWLEWRNISTSEILISIVSICALISVIVFVIASSL